MNLAQADIRALPVADNSIDLIWTDPPYPTEYLYCYEWLANEAMRVLRPGGFVATMCGGANLPKIFRYFEDSGLTYFYECTHKSNGEAPRVWRHTSNPAYAVVAKSKPIVMYVKGRGSPRIGNMLNLFEVTEGWTLGKLYHKWGQDVNSARYYIDYLSSPGDIVLDPFVGGGTTMIAAELIGRRFVGFDVELSAVRTSQQRRIETDVPTALPLFA
jgi:DNA modification methylase